MVSSTSDFVLSTVDLSREDKIVLWFVSYSYLGFHALERAWKTWEGDVAIGSGDVFKNMDLWRGFRFVSFLLPQSSFNML